jgi:hypothetical protein
MNMWVSKVPLLHPTIEIMNKSLASNARDMMFFTEAFILLTVFRFALAVFPVKKILGFTTHQTSNAVRLQEVGSQILPEPAERAIWAIKAVVRLSKIDFVCFPQSLAGYWMLRRRDVSSKIVYGVGRENQKLIAHTWLKFGDRALIGGEIAHKFSPIGEWP